MISEGPTMNDVPESIIAYTELLPINSVPLNLTLVISICHGTNPF